MTLRFESFSVLSVQIYRLNDLSRFAIALCRRINAWEVVDSKSGDSWNVKQFSIYISSYLYFLLFQSLIEKVRISLPAANESMEIRPRRVCLALQQDTRYPAIPRCASPPQSRQEKHSSGADVSVLALASDRPIRVGVTDIVLGISAEKTKLINTPYCFICTILALLMVLFRESF